MNERVGESVQTTLHSITPPGGAVGVIELLLAALDGNADVPFAVATARASLLHECPLDGKCEVAP